MIDKVVYNWNRSVELEGEINFKFGEPTKTKFFGEDD